jgi:hypothetical protein
LAIVVGISDYKSISDLKLCDEDATDWYRFLHSRGYDVKLLGDPHQENYPAYDGLATEGNFRSLFQSYLRQANSDDTIVLTSAGHGSGDGRGNSFLCMYDYTGREDGKYTDKELLADLKLATKHPKIFIFIDHCFSGGFLDELKTYPNVACLTACTQAGYGYDYFKQMNGAWTYMFLQRTLIEQFKGDATVSEAFAWAQSNYAQVTGYSNGRDRPQGVINLPTNFRL